MSQVLDEEIRQTQTLDESHQEQEETQQPQTLDDPQREEDEILDQPQHVDKLGQPTADEREQEAAAEATEEVNEEASKELDEGLRIVEEKLEEQRVPQAGGVAVPEKEPVKPRRRRKNPMTIAQRAFDAQKLAVFRENFNPIPFSPRKTLDFSVHEELFRALNLWKFVSLDLSSEIRSDLLILLIANHDRLECRSFVGSLEFSVGRLDLARALRLPVENVEEAHQDFLVKDNSKEVIQDFLSNYILLEDEDEDEDDMCILPEEVVVAAQLVKEGRANKVDWAGLMWVFVEKELSEVPASGSYHYASHLQCLMKSQHPWLFEKDAGEEAVSVYETDSSMEVSGSLSEEEDGDVCGINARSLEEFQNVDSERQGPGLRLGLGENGDLMDGIENCEGSERRDWIDGVKDGDFDHCLRRCSSNEVRGMEFENLCKGDKGGDREEFSNLERLTSTDLLHSMGQVQVTFSPRMNSLDRSSGDFVSMGLDRNINVSVENGPGGSNFFANNGKRHVDEDDFGRFDQNSQLKRMRCGEVWEEQLPPPPSDFESSIEQIQYVMEKLKAQYAQQEQQSLGLHVQLEYVNEMLEKKDQIIHTLEKTQVEEHQKWLQTVQQYEHELNIVSSLVVCYKKALKDTQNKFAEYREKCPQGDEPLYVDAGGPGGLVVTLGEFERLRLEQEEEMCRTAEEAINDFQCDWLVKFEVYREKVMMLHRRLLELEGEVKFIKESYEEHKGKDT